MSVNAIGMVYEPFDEVQMIYNRFSGSRDGRVNWGEVGELHNSNRLKLIKYVEKTHAPVMGLEYGFKLEGFLRIWTKGGWSKSSH